MTLPHFTSTAKWSRKERCVRRVFSKDGKIGKTQILFGLLIDKHKQPIGYRIYKGNTFEEHTFEQAIEQLKRKGHHYCLKAENNTAYTLDEEKIKQAAKYDGFLVVTTYIKSNTPSAPSKHISKHDLCFTEKINALKVIYACVTSLTLC